MTTNSNFNFLSCDYLPQSKPDSDEPEIAATGESFAQFLFAAAEQILQTASSDRENKTAFSKTEISSPKPNVAPAPSPTLNTANLVVANPIVAKDADTQKKNVENSPALEFFAPLANESIQSEQPETEFAAHTQSNREPQIEKLADATQIEKLTELLNVNKVSLVEAKLTKTTIKTTFALDTNAAQIYNKPEKREKTEINFNEILGLKPETDHAAKSANDSPPTISTDFAADSTPILTTDFRQKFSPDFTPILAPDFASDFTPTSAPDFTLNPAPSFTPDFFVAPPRLEDGASPLRTPDFVAPEIVFAEFPELVRADFSKKPASIFEKDAAETDSVKLPLDSSDVNTSPQTPENPFPIAAPQPELNTNADCEKTMAVVKQAENENPTQPTSEPPKSEVVRAAEPKIVRQISPAPERGTEKKSEIRKHPAAKSEERAAAKDETTIERKSVGLKKKAVGDGVEEISAPIEEAAPRTTHETNAPLVAAKTEIAAPANVAAQIAEKIVELSDAAKVFQAQPRRVRIKLNPEELGTLEIRLETNANGKLQAHLAAETETTRRVLGENLARLRESLERAGWSVENLTVSADTDSVKNVGNASLNSDSSAMANNSGAQQQSQQQQPQSQGQQFAANPFFTRNERRERSRRRSVSSASQTDADADDSRKIVSVRA